MGQTIQHATQVEAYLTAAASTASGGLPRTAAVTPTPSSLQQMIPSTIVETSHIPGNDPNRLRDVIADESNDEPSSIERIPEL